ncbi:glutathione S-transferase [Thalassovita aquimarina]|uniref:Glutathione S-transferase n=1 Tax=Thalassovita aquimarina TaxID=2785917 RepID=A0ABS5HPS0_9RHOB|nr:glutathione S-transferase [Thalassovita aquimarina]MBR9650964.1 glutathione S-transferase [Thalassovita aquimarina]
MSYQLYIGDQSFSSWSLRGWLMLEKFGLPYETHLAGLYSSTFQQDLAGLSPAHLVPVLKTPEGTVIGETQAIAEELNSRHPELQMWPEDPAARAFARWISAEMHAGFAVLRAECPMQLLHQYAGFAVSDTLRADLDRLELLWTKAREDFGAEGPWLFGRYSLADCFYAPVAARIAGYDLPVGDVASYYVATTLADPAFQSWRAAGLEKSYDPVPYAMDLPTKVWPGA